MTVNSQDHVAFTQARVGGRGARANLGDLSSGAGFAINCGAAVLKRNTQVGVGDFTILDQLLGHLIGQVNGDSEADTDISATRAAGGGRAQGGNGGVNTDNSSL